MCVYICAYIYFEREKSKKDEDFIYIYIYIWREKSKNDEDFLTAFCGVIYIQ